MSWEIEESARPGVSPTSATTLSPRIILIGSLDKSLFEKAKDRFELIRATQADKQVEVIVCLTASEIRDVQNGLLRDTLALPGEAYKVTYLPEHTLASCTRLSRDWITDGSALL